MICLQNAQFFFEKVSLNRESEQVASYVFDRVRKVQKTYDPIKPKQSPFSWNTSHMGHGIFALAGPGNDQAAAMFFLDILNVRKHDYPEIKYIVCLGNIEHDFIDYFMSSKAFYINNFHVNIQCLSKISIYRANEYQLDITYQYGDIKEHKQLNVIHLATPDMQPLNWDNETMQTVNGLLLPILENGNGIAVHCMAGLGRTGHFVSYLLLCHFKWFEKIFADDVEEKIFERLAEFLTTMRQARADFVIKAAQFWASLIDALRYFESIQDCQ